MDQTLYDSDLDRSMDRDMYLAVEKNTYIAKGCAQDKPFTQPGCVIIPFKVPGKFHMEQSIRYYYNVVDDGKLESI